MRCLHVLFVMKKWNIPSVVRCVEQISVPHVEIPTKKYAHTAPVMKRKKASLRTFRVPFFIFLDQ